MRVTKPDKNWVEMEKPEWLIQMEAVLDLLNEGVIISDDCNQILFSSSRFVEMTGISREDLIESYPSHFYSAHESDFNSRGEMLGVAGVQEIVRQVSLLPAEEMKQGILDAVAAWREGSPTDDVSLMLVHIR